MPLFVEYQEKRQPNLERRDIFRDKIMKNYYCILFMFLIAADMHGMQKNKNIVNFLRQREQGNFLPATFEDIEKATVVERWLSDEDRIMEGLTEPYRWKLHGICEQMASVIVSRPSCLGKIAHKLASFKNEKIIWGMIFMKLTEDCRYQYNQEILEKMVVEYNFDVNFIDQSIPLIDCRRTPLHGAVSRYDATFITMLLGWGANPFMQDTSGQTPLENLMRIRGNKKESSSHLEKIINLLNSTNLED